MLQSCPWIVACQAPLSMGFSRQEYWSGLSCPPPGDLPNPGAEPASLMFPPLIRGAGSRALSPMVGCRRMTRAPTWRPEIFPHFSVGETGQPLGDGKRVSVTALGKQRLHGLTSLFFFFFSFYSYYLFIFGCAGSSWLLELFSSCSERGLLSSCGVRASHCGHFSCCGVQALGRVGFSSCAHGLSTCGFWAPKHKRSHCGARAQLLRGMWKLPRSGIEPVSCIGRWSLYY